MDPLQWMGAVRMRVQTADKYCFCFKLCLICAYFSPDSDKMYFLLKKAEEFSQKQKFKVINILMIDLFLTNMQIFVSQALFFQLCGLSFWRHPFTAEDPLVSKWLKQTQCSISPNLFWWRNKLIYILDGLKVRKCSANYIPLNNFMVMTRVENLNKLCTDKANKHKPKHYVCD